tara:strand:+ start:202 stop:507 length:306 start_codon:yes stop_codon:yes gene_type:complete
MKKIKKKKDIIKSVEATQIDLKKFDFNKVLAITNQYETPNYSFIHLYDSDEALVLPMPFEQLIELWSQRANNFTHDTAMDISEGDFRGIANASLIDNKSLH